MLFASMLDSSMKRCSTNWAGGRPVSRPPTAPRHQRDLSAMDPFFAMVLSFLHRDGPPFSNNWGLSTIQFDELVTNRASFRPSAVTNRAGRIHGGLRRRLERVVFCMSPRRGRAARYEPQIKASCSRRSVSWNFSPIANGA